MDTKALEAVALSVRTLTMDAVQRANSGHPGLPMGCAELGALLYGEVMKHNPAAPDWIDRDRFVLSAGHGSMLLYALLYLAGYGMTLDDIKTFRRVGSPAAGHPEYGAAKGIETTTGPLGQGMANGVGMAMAERMLASRFNTEEHQIVDHYTYVLAGDGCMMEGVTSEAASLAGHLGLGKLIVFYDSNKISIEGSTDLAFTEDVIKRYDAYGWQTLSGDAYDLPGTMEMVASAKKDQTRPTLILLRSVIAKGSPNKAGTHGAHGAALGDDEVAATKRNLGVPEDAMFFVHPDATAYFDGKKKTFQGAYDAWQKTFAAWAEKNPELKKQWDAFFSDAADLAAKAELPAFEVGDKQATRKAGGAVLTALAGAVPNLIGGSADLAPSTNTALPDYGHFSKDDYTGRTLHFGVREHAMGAITNGLCLHGGIRPFCATFLVFSDYMRPPIRLAAMMKQPAIYVFTHDSVYLGEDGPTHQPIEQLAALRAIPNLTVLRPGDAQETRVAWQMALERTDGPTALALTRQNIVVYPKHDADWERTVRRGAYVVQEPSGKPDVVVVATGSEVSLALEAAGKATQKKVRVISMMSRELFEAQDEAFQRMLLPAGVPVVVVEAGIAQGWEGIATDRKNILAIARFGESGPGPKVGEHLGMRADALAAQITG
jgi:transketolase